MPGNDFIRREATVDTITHLNTGRVRAYAEVIYKKGQDNNGNISPAESGSIQFLQGGDIRLVYSSTTVSRGTTTTCKLPSEINENQRTSNSEKIEDRGRTTRKRKSTNHSQTNPKTVKNETTSATIRTFTERNDSNEPSDISIDHQPPQRTQWSDRITLLQ